MLFVFTQLIYGCPWSSSVFVSNAVTTVVHHNTAPDFLDEVIILFINIASYQPVMFVCMWLGVGYSFAAFLVHIQGWLVRKILTTLQQQLAFAYMPQKIFSLNRLEHLM